MGLLDQFNLDDPQTMGLLSAAANMLQASGPSLRPTSFGQIAGGGINALTSTLDAMKRRKQEEAQAAQMAQLRGMQIQEAQGGLQDHQRAREQADALRQFYTGRAQQQDAIQTPAAMGNNLAPTRENAAIMDALQPGAQQPAGGIYQQRLAEAQALRNAGFHQQADGAEAAALKFQPKVKNWQEVRAGDKVLYAPFYEDGTSGQPVPMEIARKLEFQNLGGRTAAIDPFTGKEAVSFARSQTPDSIASNAVAMRGQNMTDARAREFNGMHAEENRQKALIGKAPTEFQGKSAAFGLRATESDKILNELNGKYNPAAINSKQSVENTWLIGGALGAATNKFALSSTDQKAEQAQRDFVNAVLRQESGAAIGANEFDNAKKQYFPQPGDGPDVIAQKATNRQLAIQGFQANAGRHALTAPAATTAKKSALKGQIMDGYRFKGGDPADQNNWEKL